MLNLLRTLVVHRLGIAFLLLGTFTFCPEKAQASCGDYLSYGSGNPMNGSMDDHPATSSNAPCHGPQCTRQQSRSKLPLPLPLRIPVPDDGAITLLTPDSQNPEGFISSRIESDGDSIYRSNTILDPPRI